MKHFTNPTAKQDIKRKVRLERLLVRLNDFLPVPIARIKSVLTDAEFASFRTQFLQTTARGTLSKRSSKDLSHYNYLIGKADRLYIRSQNRKRIGSRFDETHPTRSIHRRVSHAYQEAFEFLEQVPEIWSVFDKSVVFVAGAGPDPDDPENAPRMKGSILDYALFDFFDVKHEQFKLKVTSIERSLAEIEVRRTNSFFDWNFADVDDVDDFSDVDDELL